MATWKRKQWLLAKGHIQESQAGRGRISYENKLILQQAKNDGVEFSDWPAGEVISSTADSTVTVIKPTVQSTGERGWFDVVYRYPIESYHAVDDNGKTYSMKEACNNCGLSLCAHRCSNPSIHGKPVAIHSGPRPN